MAKNPYHKEMQKEEKMTKTRNRRKQMQTFQQQDRQIEPISEDHKYMIALMKNELTGNKNENILRTTRGNQWSQHF